MKGKVRNPYFWLGIVSVVFAASGIDFNTLTSWKLLGSALISILNNPVAIVAVIGAILGIFNDNSSEGLDKFKK